MKQNHQRWIFYAVWLILLILQAAFTPLIDDEAYYWFYSTELSIGYFDHPPMIALMIKLGYFLLKNELGVRLLSVLTSFISILIIEKILVVKDFKLYATLLSTILIAQVGGILAVPDSPYLFFIVLFLFCFKRYLYHDKWINAVFLGLCAAAVLYSKYHGSMLFFFLGIFSLRLFKRKTFYLAIVTAVLCYFPHILWLVENNFPSFQYHFGDRNVSGFVWESIPLYLIGQLVLYGPLTSFIIFYALWKYKTIDEFEKIIRNGAIGVLIFLFLFCFKGSIEANWSMAVFPVFLIITHQYLAMNVRLRKAFYITAPVSIVLILIARLFLVYDFTYGKLVLNDDLHHKKEWVKKINELSQGDPVIFLNSYQQASVYKFYSGSEAISLNNVKSRMNQFSISKIEDELQGKKVMVVSNWPNERFTGTEFNGQKILYTRIERFTSYSKIYFTADSYSVHAHPGDSIKLNVHAGTRYTAKISFIENPSYKSYITYQFFKKREMVFERYTNIEVKSGIMNSDLSLTLAIPSEKGVYDMRISVSTGWLPPTISSKRWKVIVD